MISRLLFQRKQQITKIRKSSIIIKECLLFADGHRKIPKKINIIHKSINNLRQCYIELHHSPLFEQISLYFDGIQFVFMSKKSKFT